MNSSKVNNLGLVVLKQSSMRDKVDRSNDPEWSSSDIFLQRGDNKNTEAGTPLCKNEVDTILHENEAETPPVKQVADTSRSLCKVINENRAFQAVFP